MGRILAGDPVFEQQFTNNPFEASRELGASRAQAEGFVALGQAGIRQLFEQVASIRSSLGPELSRRIAEDFGVQMIMGRALSDPRFASRLQHEGDALTTRLLGKGRSASEAAAIAKSPEFTRLNGFAEHRRAMSGVAKKFYSATAMEGAKAALRDLALEQIRDEVRTELSKH
jgi:hypothetical protein